METKSKKGYANKRNWTDLIVPDFLNLSFCRDFVFFCENYKQLTCSKQAKAKFKRVLEKVLLVKRLVHFFPYEWDLTNLHEFDTLNTIDIGYNFFDTVHCITY